MNIKRQIILTIIALLLLSGCAATKFHTRSDVAISFDSEHIAYEVSGKGRTSLIFVHGWSCDGRYWDNQIPAFAADYHVITVDLAGHGHSSFNRAELSMMSFAKDIQAVLDREKVDKAILVGHSMGGGVIAEAARLMPTRVIGIIGIDTLHNVAEHIPQSEIDGFVEAFDADFTNATQDFVLSMFHKDTEQAVKDWVKTDMSSAPKTPALSAFENYLGQYVTNDAVNVFLEVDAPVITINARMWPTNEENNRMHIKNYHAFYIEDSGHFPMLEKPVSFNLLLRQSIELIESY